MAGFFITSLHTLKRGEGIWPEYVDYLKRINSKKLYIDRSSQFFSYVMLYLRNNNKIRRRYLPADSFELVSLLEEARFYDMRSFMMVIEDKLEAC